MGRSACLVLLLYCSPPFQAFTGNLLWGVAFGVGICIETEQNGAHGMLEKFVSGVTFYPQDLFGLSARILIPYQV